jgi:sodium-dependent dicarboxylate transporter 2/3/5
MAGPRTPPDPALLEDATTGFRAGRALLVGIAAILVLIAPVPGLDLRAHHTLGILVMAGGLWITESLPVAVTALTIPLMALVLGVTDAKGAFAGFGDPIVFLFFGTFLLTDAAARQGLTERLARAVLSSRWVLRRPGNLLWAVAWLGCGISAWVNNTATTAMLLPLALTAEQFSNRMLTVGTLLSASYAPSLGGLATPVGTAPNLIGIRLLEQATGHRPSFAAWCAVFAPLAILMTAISAGWLSWRARGASAAPASPVPPKAPPTAPGPWSHAERTLLPVFALVILLWITPGILAATPLQGAAWLKLWQARLPEPAVPVLGAVLLFMLPARARRAGESRIAVPRIQDVGAFGRIDWSTLLLFGGGLTLGALMFETGLARWIGEGIFRAMPIHGSYGIVLAATLMGVLVSEMTSNTASAALVVPVVLALAQAAGTDPVKPALAATAACSFGFMLPVSTPPNALVYGTGRIRIGEMVRQGVLLDLVGIVLVSLWVTLFG